MAISEYMLVILVYSCMAGIHYVLIKMNDYWRITGNSFTNIGNYDSNPGSLIYSKVIYLKIM